MTRPPEGKAGGRLTRVAQHRAVGVLQRRRLRHHHHPAGSGDQATDGLPRLAPRPGREAGVHAAGPRLAPGRVSIVSSNARITLGSTGQSARAYTQVTWSSSRAPATGHAARTRARAAARAGMSARRATQTEAVLALSAPLRRAQGAATQTGDKRLVANVRAHASCSNHGRGPAASGPPRGRRDHIGAFETGCNPHVGDYPYHRGCDVLG